MCWHIQEQSVTLIQSSSGILLDIMIQLIN